MKYGNVTCCFVVGVQKNILCTNMDCRKVVVETCILISVKLSSSVVAFLVGYRVIVSFATAWGYNAKLANDMYLRQVVKTDVFFSDSWKYDQILSRDIRLITVDVHTLTLSYLLL